MKTKIVHLLTLAFLLVSLFLPTHKVYAATIDVESTADGPANPAHCPGAACTLRDAIAKANPGDTIHFNLPSYPEVITLTNGEIDINKNLIIQGPGSADLTVSGNNASRIFDITTFIGISNVSISGMTLQDGRVVDESGGAIRSIVNLTLDDMVITQNGTTSVSEIYLYGGGIYQTSRLLTITNSQITQNYAVNRGGGMYVANASLSMTNVTVSLNQTDLANYSSGGGIFLTDNDPNDGVAVSATLNQVSLLNNTTYGEGGGIFIVGPVTATLSNSTIQENETITDDGGGINASDVNHAVTVNITNNSIIQTNLASGAGSAGGGIYINGTLNVTDSSFIGNSASAYGGGIYALGGSAALTNATLSGNQSGTGGAGIYASNIPSLTIAGSNILNNQAQSNGGGLLYDDSNGHATIQDSVFSGNQAINGGGGGLFTGGDVSIEDTTISGNSSLYDGGGIYHNGNTSFNLNRVAVSGNSATDNGGGLSLTNTGTGSITNSTFTGNSSTNDTGGVFATATTSILFNHVTIAGNTSTNYVGGFRTSGPNVSMKNSILADNIGGGSYTAFPDCLGTIQSQDYNLIENKDSNCSVTGSTTHNIIGQDPMLDTLKNNGGSTLTLSLLPGSPALDPAGNTSCLTEDQRGYSRPQDGDGNGTAICDIGALEIVGPLVVQSVTRLDADPTSASSVQFLVRFTGPVNGVDKTAPFADFEISPVGLAGTSILSVTGSGAEYTVQVSTGTGNGSIGLDVSDNDSITSISSGDPLGGTGAGNGDYLNGERYTILKDAPNGFIKSLPADGITNVPLSPTLSWDSSTDAASYEYCYSSAPGPCSAWFSAGSNTSVNLSGLASNYTYYWQVRAVNEVGSTEADGDIWWSFMTVNTPACSWNPYTAPSSPTFNDVPMNVPHWSWVQRLYNGGITAGCGNGNFCPGDAVNRASMAIFLLRGKYCGSSYIPPAVGGSTGFNDVATNVTYAPWVKQLAADGVTAGCGNSNFCPGNAVNRASMAIFLLRAKHGGTYSPPGVAGISGFNDVPADASYAPWVKQLADEGVTAGCGNGNFCPADTVNRAQMAIFLVRAFGLP